MTDSAQDNPFDHEMYAGPVGGDFDSIPEADRVEDPATNDAALEGWLKFKADEAAKQDAVPDGADDPGSDSLAGDAPEPASAEASPELVEMAHDPLAQQLFATGENSPAIEQSYVSQSQQAGSDSSASPVAPTSLEKAIGSIRLDGERQENFVMLGDPRIQDHFYNNLRDLGKLNGRGELLCSLKEAEKHYIAAAKELGQDIQVVHAMDMSYKRKGSGVLGSIKSGIQNALGQEHHMVVMVAGDQETVNAKMKELGGLVQQMAKTEMLPEGTEDNRSKVEFRDAADPGSLVIPKGGLNLQGTGKLSDLVNLTADVVNAHTRAEAEKKSAREALRNKEAEEKVKEAKEKAAAGASAGAEGGTSNSPAQPVNAFALGLADKLAAAMTSPEALKALEKDSVKKDGVTKGSPEGVVLARGINKITQDEFASLSAERRHEMLVQMAALVVKAEGQDLASKIRAEMNAPAFREKLVALAKEESVAFDARTPALVRDLVSRGVLQPDQVEKLAAIPSFASARVAQFGTQVEAIAQAGPQALASEQAREVLDKLRAILIHEVKDVAPAGVATTEMLTRLDGILKEVESGRFGAELAERVPESRATLQDMVKANEQAYLADGFKGGAHVYEQDVASAHRQAAEWLAPRAEQGTINVAEFQERVAAIAEAGPQALTVEQATDVLDKIPRLAASEAYGLVPGGVPATTTMLEQIDGILKEVESGRFGQEMANQTAWARDGWKALGLDNFAAYADNPLKGKDLHAQDAAVAREQNAEWQAERAPAEPVKLEVPQESVKSDGAEKEGIASVGAFPKGVESSSATAEPAAVAPSQEAPVHAQDSRAARDTDMAVARLTKTFDNIQVMLLEKDSNAWRANNVETLARAVTRLDPAEVAKRSVSERAVIIAQAKWVEAQAASGRLPGFSSGEGKALAEQLKARVAELAPLAKRPPNRKAQYKLENADRMVAALRSREQGLAQGAAPARQQEAPSPAAVVKELVHAVHHQPVISDASAKYLLKAVEKSGLSLETLKDLDPETKARAAVALNFLAREAQAGTIGDLSPAVQRYADHAEAKANQMFDAYAKDPQVATPLTKASFELAARTGALDIPAKDAQREASDKAAQVTEKAAGHESASKVSSAGRDRGGR